MKTGKDQYDAVNELLDAYRLFLAYIIHIHPSGTEIVGEMNDAGIDDFCLQLVCQIREQPELLSLLRSRIKVDGEEIHVADGKVGRLESEIRELHDEIERLQAENEHLHRMLGSAW
ncbi:MAG: hypothetical protein FGM24_04465 [Candidatus Kapabacteria bacterium]|nr:hypothetical protein [Candidatus Kapabacteria bacterium]